MKTGSWRTYMGPGRIGIALGSPRGAPAGYRFYRALAPTRDMLAMDHEAYLPRYEAILARLDPQRVWDEIHALAGTGEAALQIEPVLMCFEKPPFGPANWCHRRLAAAWFEQALGVVVEEVAPPC